MSCQIGLRVGENKTSLGAIPSQGEIGLCVYLICNEWNDKVIFITSASERHKTVAIAHGNESWSDGLDYFSFVDNKVGLVGNRINIACGGGASDADIESADDIIAKVVLDN